MKELKLFVDYHLVLRNPFPENQSPVDPRLGGPPLEILEEKFVLKESPKGYVARIQQERHNNGDLADVLIVRTEGRQDAKPAELDRLVCRAQLPLPGGIICLCDMPFGEAVIKVMIERK